MEQIVISAMVSSVISLLIVNHEVIGDWIEIALEGIKSKLFK